MMQYLALPFVLGWHAPVWWDFLPALQELQEPTFLQQPQHIYEKSVFETNIVLQTLETLASEDSKKQLLLTFVLMFVTSIILTICLARWRQTQRRIRFSHFEKPQQMVVMTDDDTMMEDSFDVVDNAEFVEFWKHESEESDDVILPSEQPQVTTPVVENLHPRKDLLNIFNAADGMAEPNNITLADLLANQNHSPQMKRTPPRQDSMLLNESPRKQYLRKSKVFSDFCVFMNKGVYTLPGRLWEGLKSVFMVNKGQKKEAKEPRPRYVKAWYAADQIPEHLITESFAEMNVMH